MSQIVELKHKGPTTTAEIIIRQNERSDLDTYVNVNNHYEGCAPLTIQRLLDVLR